MSVTIFTTQETIDNLEKIKGLDYYERVADEGHPCYGQPGWAIHPKLTLAALPEGSAVGLEINTKVIDFYRDHVSFPVHLRGCVFSKAPNLPEKYEEIIAYWSHDVSAPEETNAVYAQNPMNEYMVDMHKLDSDDEPDDEEEAENCRKQMDSLLTEGIVVHIKELGELIKIHNLQPDHYIGIGIPVDMEVFGDMEGDFNLFDEGHQYNLDMTQSNEKIFLKVSDVLASPDPENVYIEVLRYEMMDYGYFY